GSRSSGRSSRPRARPSAPLASPRRRHCAASSEVSEHASVDGFVLSPIQRELPIMLRLVVEFELAVLPAEVVRRALVPDHPVCVVRIHGLPAYRTDRRRTTEPCNRSTEWKRSL